MFTFETDNITTMISTNTFHFLIDLQLNNNRKWFQENKARYETARNEFEEGVNELILGLKKFDSSIGDISAKDCMFRIYRDVRFSKNKEPYKTNFGAFIGKGGRKSKYAGYYIHLEPDKSFFGGGIYKPDAQTLKILRTGIYKNPESYKEIINAPHFKQLFPELYGEKLKNAPKGFPKDFADIDLLKSKQFVSFHKVENELFVDEKWLEKSLDIYQTLYPFNAYLNEILG